MSYYIIRKYTAEWVEPPLYVLVHAEPDGREVVAGGDPAQHRHVAAAACTRASRKGLVVFDEETGITIKPGESFATAYARSTGGYKWID